MKKRMIVIGGGGHARVIIDAAKKSGAIEICGILDARLPVGAIVSGIRVIGADDKLPELSRKGIRYAFIGVGSIGDCAVRKSIYNKLKREGFELPVIIHPSAVIAEDINIKEGAFVAAGAVIGPNVRIGKNTIINTSSSVDHDCVIGDFVHIAPGAVLSGDVKVGDEAHIGTGANVIQGLSIGQNTIIGAGMTVRKDVPNDSKYYPSDLVAGKRGHETE